MPPYEFVCKSCEKGFEVMLTLVERAKAKSKCPSCGSEKVTVARALELGLVCGLVR